MAVLNMALASLSLTGIPVHSSFYSSEEPTITHGIIEVDNRNKEGIHFSILRVRCLAKGDKITIATFFVYRLPDYEEEDPDNIEQLPQTTVQYEISFAPIPATPYLGGEIQIDVELQINNETSSVYSPYYMTRRIEKRP